MNKWKIKISEIKIDKCKIKISEIKIDKLINYKNINYYYKLLL